MHELGTTRSVVAIADEHARGAKVLRVTLEIGKLSGVLPEAVRLGTLVEDARLEIVEVPGRARCRDCGSELTLDQRFGRCVCGGTDLELIAGEELKLKEMEVEECVQPAAVLRQTVLS